MVLDSAVQSRLFKFNLSKGILPPPNRVPTLMLENIVVSYGDGKKSSTTGQHTYHEVDPSRMNLHVRWGGTWNLHEGKHSPFRCSTASSSI